MDPPVPVMFIPAPLTVSMDVAALAELPLTVESCIVIEPTLK
jgi:hypothetical protein